MVFKKLAAIVGSIELKKYARLNDPGVMFFYIFTIAIGFIIFKVMSFFNKEDIAEEHYKLFLVAIVLIAFFLFPYFIKFCYNILR